MAANALLELQSEKEAVNRAETAHAAAQATASSAKRETEAVQHELKKSWEVEAKLKSQVQWGKEELESTPLNPNCLFVLFFLCMTYAYRTEFREGARKQLEHDQAELHFMRTEWKGVKETAALILQRVYPNGPGGPCA